MWRTGVLLLSIVSVSACTLPPEPMPEVVPALVVQELRSIREDLATLHQDVGAMQQRVESLMPLAERVARLELFPQVPPSGRQPRSKRQETTPAPTQIVTEAQHIARIGPSERGYFGKSAEQVYTWQPGRVFTVYLCWSHPTGIFLPPGERAMVGLELDKETYNVSSELVGLETAAYTAMTIRPLFEQGEVDGLVVTDTGKRYLFHFIIGKVGMMAVTFETPTLHQTLPQEQGLPLARPRP